MVEVRFKPADVGSVADGAVTEAKLAAGAVTVTKIADGAITGAKVNVAAAIEATKLANLPESQITNLTTDLAAKVSGTGTTGDKVISKIGWDSATGEVIIDHAV
jgi:outer membrane receptor protein involved in Fe transport